MLVSGGANSGVVSATAEALDTTGTFAPSATMLEARRDHASVVLDDGRVLVAGGTTNSGAATASAEVYDPTTSTWSAVGAMAQPRT
ncbi:MAG TPA: kelch repeat-containing protein, partial [Planctomycetota bacterium]